MSDDPNGGGNDARREFAAAFRSRGFVLVLGVMLCAALGLNTAQRAMKLHFQKERVELRRTLDRLPAELGPWLKVVDTQLGDDVEHTLATKDYVQRTYVDTRKLRDAAEVAELKALSGAAREQRVEQIRQRDASAVVNLHVAYYTGLIDTVAHVPERCYVAGGYNPENADVVALAAFPNVPGRSPNLKVKYAEYRDRARPQQPVRDIAYCFQVNGKYEFDSIKGVRFRLQNIFEKYGYYAKIELATFLGDDTKRAQSTMADFLSFAMPEIELCLPDWHAITGQDAPLNAGQ